MYYVLPDITRKGRGAISNRAGRFELTNRYRTDDGWSTETEEPDRIATSLYVDSARTIIARNKSPDLPFDRSVNPYRGCEHGCIYCFARSTHAYYGLSAGLDFETRLIYKPDAADCLRAELGDPNYLVGALALGTNTDPYHPIERNKKLTRQILEVLAEYNHPVSIVTKSDLVLRDADIISAMAAKGLAIVTVSVTTLDPCLARKLEPRAPTPRKRLATLGALAAFGIPTGVLAAPMIPALNDMELENILEDAAKVGARRAGYVLLRLPGEIAELFREWLEAHFPDKAAHVINLTKETRGGAKYDSRWGLRSVGSGPYANMLQQRFKVALRKYGLDNGSYGFDTTQFRRPPRKGDQLNLF